MLSCSGSIISAGEERANLTAIVLVNMWFLFGEVFSSSRCLGWVRYFIVASEEIIPVAFQTECKKEKLNPSCIAEFVEHTN